MASGSTPKNGDVVVRAVQGEAGRSLYVLFVVPGKGQFAYGERDEATARAVRYAERTSVNAWYAEPEGRFEALAEFRSGAALMQPASLYAGRRNASHTDRSLDQSGAKHDLVDTWLFLLEVGHD